MDEAQHQDDIAASDGAKLERQLTHTESEAIRHPGDVRINVKGAFIVDEQDQEPSSPGEDFDIDGYQHDSKDIRLPNHKAVVSHIAVDVRAFFSLVPPSLFLGLAVLVLEERIVLIL